MYGKSLKKIPLFQRLVNTQSISEIGARFCEHFEHENETNAVNSFTKPSHNYCRSCLLILWENLRKVRWIISRDISVNVKSTPNLKVMPPTARQDLLIPIVYRASQSCEKLAKGSVKYFSRYKCKREIYHKLEGSISHVRQEWMYEWSVLSMHLQMQQERRVYNGQRVILLPSSTMERILPPFL